MIEISIVVQISSLSLYKPLASDKKYNQKFLKHGLEIIYPLHCYARNGLLISLKLIAKNAFSKLSK